MSFEWAEYLNLAKELAGQNTIPSSQDSKLRSAISRAYYAAFCKARNHLRDRENNLVPYGENPHQYVPNQFKNRPDKMRKEVGANLDRLRTDRNKADYNDTVAGLSAATKKALILAEQVISILGRL